jgi:hypothetical protein
MSLRKKNLLEAFNKKTDAPSAPARPPAPSEASSSPTPLFERQFAPPRSGAGRIRDTAWALLAIGLVLAFVLGFVVGRTTKVEARAGGPTQEGTAPRPRPTNQPRSFQERPPANPGAETAPKATPPAASGPERIEDSPLFDPANLFTVVVASYTKSNKDLAWATHQHLVDAKLPVFPPVESRNLVVVLAGAAPTSAELEKVESAVKALARDGQRKDYSDAYRARIDTLIPREKKGTSKP